MTNDFLWPEAVRPGEVIGVTAPASPVEQDACEEGVRLLRQWGFEVCCGSEVMADRPWGQDTDRQLAGRFQEIWRTARVRAVMGARGGYGSLKILPYLDLEVLRSKPRRLVGFSDLTNLLWHLHRELRLVTFHGPTVAQLPHLTPAARNNFFSWLTAGEPLSLTYRGLTVLQGGAGEGPLAGGNLTTFCHLLGTPYAPRFRGYLLFLEDQNEALYRLDRLVHHLLLAGGLEGVAGVILGAFTACGESQEQVWEVLGLALNPLGVPVLAGLPVGHQPDNHTIPLGARARLESAAGSLAIL